MIGECSRLAPVGPPSPFRGPLFDDDLRLVVARDPSAPAPSGAVTAVCQIVTGRQVGWTDELELLLPIEISEIEAWKRRT